MHAERDDADGIEVLPVVMVVRAFPARPSSVPDIRDFVRQHLAQTALSHDYVRTLSGRVANVLLESAGMGGTIQVSLRIFADYAEVDVLSSDQITVIEDVPPPAEASRPVATAEARAGPSGQSFAAWLGGALRREGMTLEAAAREIKVSVKTVSRWVSGTTEPRLRDLSRIREVFGDLPFP